MKGAEKIFAFVEYKYIKEEKPGFFIYKFGISGIWKLAAILIMLIFTQLSVSAQTGNTWYNYSVDNSDNWDDPNRWTLDPDGSLLINPSGMVPGANDTVVILNGSTVNITTNTKKAAMLEIKSGGILNISGTTTGHNFAVIKGEGRIKLSADNYPAGDDTEFRNHGTVEYTGGSTTYYLNTLNSSKTFYNLIINLNSPVDSVTLTTPDTITINNDLEIRRGNLKINDATPNRKIIINVLGNVKVQSEGKITTGKGNPWASVGYDYGAWYGGGKLPAAGNFHKIYHELNISGDLENFGNIRFTNLSSPLYNDFAANGAVTVRFNGMKNNKLNLYGPAVFYNLVIDKGNNQTYITTIYSANNNYFKLFGGNALERLENGANDPNPEVRKALWIKNGTLRLTGNINIPSLTEGYLSLSAFGRGDYTIGANACLWIDGDNVIVNGTADANFGTPISVGVSDPQALTYQGLSVFGKFRITKGNYNGNGSSGMMLFSNDEATIQIEGGNVNICQMRNYMLAPGKATYYQSGGTFTVRGNKGTSGWVLDLNPLFELSDANSIFMMSGGDINLFDVTGFTNNGLYINSAVGNYNVTGGNINVQVDGGVNFDIFSTANLWNLNVQRLNATGLATVRLRRDISIANDLIINDNAAFDPSPDNGTTNYNVSIGHNLTIGSFSGSTTARFYPRNNTTTFNGSGNSLITVSGSSLNNCFNPNHLVINKANAASKVSLAYRPGVADTVARVRGNFTITNGTFDYGAYYLTVAGNLDNNGVMGVWNTKGKIVLRNTAAMQTITAGINPSVIFGHLDVAHTDGSTNHVQLNSNISCDLFTLTSGRVFLQNYKLSVDTNMIITVSGSFGVDRMIEMMSDHGNRGLQLNMTNNYSVASTIVTFPIGTFDGTTHRWTKLDVTIGSIGSVSGYLTAIAVPLQHPTKLTACDAMAGYWKTVATGLNGITSDIQYTFTNRFPNPGGGGGDKKYYFINGTWNSDKNNYTWSNNLVYTTGQLNGFADGEFTIGKNSCFNNVNYVYSNGLGGGIWNANSSWEGGKVPATYDYAIIRNGDIISTNSGADDAGTVIINAGGTLDVGTVTGLSYGFVSGGGKFRIASDNATSPTLPNADFDPFLLNDSATFEYYGAGSYTLPSTASGGAALNYYPNLKIGGTSGSVKTLPSSTITIRKDLMIYDDSNSGAVLKLNPGAGAGDLIIQDSLKFRNGGTLMFPAAGAKRMVSVEKSIDFADGGNADANSIQVENAAATYANNFHSLIVKEDIRMNDNSSVLLFRDKTRRAVDLFFRGYGNSRITSSASNIKLNYFTIDKDNPANIVSVLSNIDLTDDSDMALKLISGSLILDHNNIDFYLTSGDGNFNIPETSRLTLTHGILRLSGNGNGILLNNSIRLQNNSQLLMSNAGENNFIEYSSTGNSELLIEDNAILTVGGQIRRKTTTESGTLLYRQTGSGSVVTVGDRSAGNPSRGMLEILNPGSNFTHTGGSLIIGRGQNNVDPALYLDPENYSISGGTKIIFGNTNTPASQNIGIFSAIPLKDLEVSNAGAMKSVTVYTLPLNIDSLRILDGQTFNANSNNIYFKGNLHLFNGAAYTPGSNTTSFSGSRQKIIGGITFHNLTVATSDSVRLYDDITINNTFSINSGSQISDRQKKITLKGNIVNDGRHYSESMNVGGLIFQGSTRQKIAGAGIYGIMIVNNNNGVELQNNFTLVDRNVRLQNGSFFLREYQLAIGEKANITADGGFSKDRMLVTNGAVSDLGIKKYVPSGTSSDIFFPIGVTGKYTPVTFTNLAVTESGYVFIRPVNLAHPTALDPSNVLQYYWNIQTSNFTSFNAHINFKYLNSDVRVTAPNLESDYIPAYLNDVSWAKFGSENVDEVNDTISFTFNTGTNIDGDFTAGINTAIPDKVPVYYTVKNGNWEDPAIWAREDGLPVTAFPNGYVVRIRHNVTVSADLKSAYKTIIEQGGKVDIGTTIRHYFGVVSGRGHLSLSTGRLPAGNYRQFFTCDGGTIEYGGSASYEIPNESLFYRRLIFSGGGTKVLASNDITVCDTLLINGPVVDNSTHDNQITIKGLLEKTSGTFNAGTGSNATIVFSGTTPQQIKGDFTGASILNNIVMNNAAGLTMGGNVTMAGKLTLSNGAITTGSNTFLMEIASTVTPVAGSATSFINGPLHKKLANGSDFTFPVGKGTRNGYVSLLSTSTATERIWKAEYFNTGYTDLTTSPATFKVTGSEYWKINSAVDNDGAIVKLRWDALSDINPLTTTNGINDIRVAEYNGTDWVEKPSSASGNSSAGTVQTSSVIPIKVSSNPQYYTLGSISTLKPTITLGTNPQVCLGSISASLPYLALSGSPVDYAIDYDVTAQGQGFLDKGWTALPSSPVNLTIPATATAGTYNATIQVRNATIASVPYSFTVRILPGNAISAASSTPSVCINTPLSVTHSSTGATGIGTPSGLPSGVNAAWSANTVTISGTPVVSGIYNYSIPLSGGCGNVSATGTITVNSLPTVSILFTESSGSISNDGTICKGDQVVITAGGGTSYLWSPAAGLSAANIANPVAVPAVTTTYTVTVTDNNSCINMANALVTVMPIPATGDMYRKPNN